MADLLLVGQFIANKVGKTGLTVTVDVDRYALADGSRTALVTAGSATEGRRGLYHYRLADADLATYQYVATFITADTSVDQQEIAALGLVVPDVLVSSRLAPTTAGRTLDVEATGEASANVTLWKGDTPASLDVDGNVPTAGGGLTAQETADALLLAPSGAAADGSAMAQLSNIAANTAVCASVAANSTDATAAGAITRKRGNSWSIALTLGEVTGYTSLWFTIKSSYDDADSAALLHVKLNNPSASDGLLYVNGAAAADSTKGSITVSDASTGAIIVAVDETITDDLAPGTYYYDAQALIDGDVTTPDSGTFTITADVTRSVV